MRNSLRFALAIIAVIAVGLGIYFLNPAPDQPHDTKQNHKEDEDKQAADPKIKVALPEVNLNQHDAKEAPQYETLKKQAQSMHATMNNLANAGAFDGAALNTGQIKQDLQTLNTQLTATKQNCTACSPELQNYFAKLKRLTDASLKGDTHTLAALYANISKFDQALNGAQALKDVRDLDDLFNDEKAQSQFETLDQWIKDAKARLDSQTGDLRLGHDAVLEQKMQAAEEKWLAADQKAKKLEALAKQGKTEEARSEALKQAKAARKQAEALKKAADAAKAQWEQMQQQGQKQDAKAFAKQAKQYANQFSGEANSEKTQAQIQQIRNLSDALLKNSQDTQQQLEALQQAFAQLQASQTNANK